MPKQARWSQLQAKGKQLTISKLLDAAMIAIEKGNVSLIGVVPTDSAPPWTSSELGELIDLIGIELGNAGSSGKD